MVVRDHRVIQPERLNKCSDFIGSVLGVIPTGGDARDDADSHIQFMELHCTVDPADAFLT